MSTTIKYQTIDMWMVRADAVMADPERMAIANEAGNERKRAEMIMVFAAEGLQAPFALDPHFNARIGKAAWLIEDAIRRGVSAIEAWDFYNKQLKGFYRETQLGR